jgi:uncharacterized protein (TIGR02246 family)
MRRVALLSLALAFVALDAGAQAADRAADEAAIKAVIRAFVDTREANDEAALRALLTADVDQLQTSGHLRSGRDAVVAGSLETTRSTGGRRTITIESVRFLGSDVALADGPYDSVGRSDGADVHMHTSIVLRREGRVWKIAAIRNMRPPSGAR